MNGISAGVTARREASASLGVIDALIWRLLDKYEAGTRFESPEARDVLLHLDERDFPTAFSPDGRDELDALTAATETLASQSAIRIVRHRVRGGGERVELRLGPGEVAAAYAVGTKSGYWPLRDCLSELVAHVDFLRNRRDEDAVPAWWDDYLAVLSKLAAAGDLQALHIADRARLKADWIEIRDALTAADALSRSVDSWERHVSESLFSDSKRISRIRPRIARILRDADPRWLDVPAGEATESMRVLEAYGIRRRPPVVILAGDLPIRIGGELAPTYRLADFEPVATLPAAWSEALAIGIREQQVSVITTVENEYPFLAYVEESGGPRGLGERREVVIYIGGFPSKATFTLLSKAVQKHPGVQLRHWGDADVGGLGIWWFLRNRLGRSVDLFRTTGPWVAQAASREGRPLASTERRALSVLLSHVTAAHDANKATDLRAAIDLARTLLDLNIKIEQERL